MSLQKEQLPRQSIMKLLAFQRGQKCKEKGKQEAEWELLTGAARLLAAPWRAFPCATSGGPAAWGQLLRAAEQNACVVASTPRME